MDNFDLQKYLKNNILLKESFHKNVTDENYKSYIEEMILDLVKDENFAKEQNIKNLSIGAREEYMKANFKPEDLYKKWLDWTGGMGGDDWKNGNYDMGF